MLMPSIPNALGSGAMKPPTGPTKPATAPRVVHQKNPGESQLRYNKRRGDGFRDVVVRQLRNAGVPVQSEVDGGTSFMTPYGSRRYDAYVEVDGHRTGVEAKWNGASRSIKQELKDRWLQDNGYLDNVFLINSTPSGPPSSPVF